MTSVITIGALALTACSGEDLIESAVENRIEAESGEDVDLDFSDGGFSVQTDEGEMTIDGETGEFQLETDEGSFSATQSDELPDDFPGEIPVPDLAVDSVTRQDLNGQTSYAVVFGAVDDASAFIEEYGSALEGAGFTAAFETTSGDSVGAQFTNDTWGVTVSATSGELVSLVVAPSSG